MSNETTGGFCRDCNKNTLFTRAGTSHVLHLIMTIITVGVWLIFWIGSCIKFGGWSCTQCGCTTRKARRTMAGQEASPLSKIVNTIDQVFEKPIDQPYFDQSQRTTEQVLTNMVKEDKGNG